MTDLTQLRVSAASPYEQRLKVHQRKVCRKKLRFETPEEAERVRVEKTAQYSKPFRIYQCRGTHYHLTSK